MEIGFNLETSLVAIIVGAGFALGSAAMSGLIGLLKR
jgi:hypothetical protein